MRKTLSLALLAASFASTAFAASLTLVAPNGGEELTLGSTHEIRWNAIDVRQRIKLVLIRSGGAVVGVIASDLAAAPAAFTWTVGRYQGGTAEPGSNYKIRIKTMDDSLADVSDSSFTIGTGVSTPVLSIRTQRGTPTRLPATTVRVTNPITGAAVTHGDEVSITWEHANARPGQRLKVFAKRYTARCHQETGYNLLIPLGTLPIEAGRLNWEVSPTVFPAHTFSILLEPAVAGDFAAAESDLCFEVKSRTTIQVLEPNGGEIYSRGSTIPVRLQMTHFEPRFMRVSVYLWQFDDACDSTIIGTYCNGFDSNLTECGCQIIPALPAGKYKIALDVYAGELYHPSGTDPVARYAFDSSDACFTVR